jgi:sugar phosphate isomerase/epimerase
MDWTKVRSMDRRAFLGALAAAGAGSVALSACATAGAAQGGRLDRVGVQLYTVRDRMQQNVPQTLQQVAAIGYREVETAGLYNLTPQQFRAELDRAGLVSPAGHNPITALRDNLETTLATAQTLGQRWVVVPWLDQAERNPAGYRRLAQDLNRAGTAARERGLRVGYHNHEFEFDVLEGGRSGYDILLAETDPALVDFELDLFWAVQAGHDPTTIFARHPGRFPLCHVKDMADIGGAQRMVEVGRGEIDFARIFGQAQQAGLRHFFVEHDNPDNSMESIRNSFQHLQQLSF